MNEKPKNEITDKVEDTTDPSPEAVTTKKAEVRSKRLKTNASGGRDPWSIPNGSC